MPIPVASVISRIREVGLDAQPNTNFYNDTDDIIPAIDSSVKWLVSVINMAKAQNKATEEVLRELSKCFVYSTSELSRIIFEESIWSIDAVAPLCDSTSNGTTPPAPPTTKFNSVKLTDQSFVISYYSAYRKTIEEVNQNRLNPMSPGFMPELLTQSDLTEGSKFNIAFAYVPSYDYIQGASAPGAYIEILPHIPKKKCAVFFVENPAEITAANQTIQFPVSCFNLIYEKALQFISYSQGDGTNIWGVTESDISKLFKAVS